jgi:hypothetical protein
MYRRGRKPCALGIKSVASEEDFYTLKSPQVGIPQNAPDEFLKNVESQAAPVIKRLITASKLELSENEITIIAVFVATLATRTPMSRERAVNVRLAMRKKLLKDLAEDPEEYHRVISELNLAKTKEEDEAIRKTLLNVEENFNFSLEGDVEDFSLQQSFKTGETLANILVQKYWVLIEAPSPQMFVTSDNPFVTLVPIPYIPGMDVNPINAECLLPISPQRALLFSNRIEFKNLYKISKERMRSWVQQIISFGHESIFASISSDYIQKEFDKIPAGEITKIPVSSLPKVLQKKRPSRQTISE